MPLTHRPKPTAAIPEQAARTSGTRPTVRRANAGRHGGKLNLVETSPAVTTDETTGESPPAAEAPFGATVVITTRNRREALRSALQSALEQRGTVEVLVVDDGSTDGTSALVRDEFPEARLIRASSPQGSIVQRNLGFSEARGPVVLSLDDDAVFSSSDTVAEALAELDHPRVGAVALPLVDVRQSGRTVRPPAPPGRSYVGWGFLGSGVAVRRDLFLHLGGYRAAFFRQNEEKDFCIRMLDAGYVTRLGTGSPVHHFESPVRDRGQILFYQCRNDVLYAWYDVPMPYLPLHMLGTTVKALSRLRRPREMRPVLQGLAAGYRACIGQRRYRRPVARRTYRLFRRLSVGGPLPLDDVEPLLRPIVTDGTGRHRA